MVSSRLLSLALVCGASSAFAQGTLLINGENFRDPTRPPRVIAAQVQDSVEIEANSEFAVTFIRAGSDNSAAVINGTLVSVGGTIDGAVVRSISADTVTLELNGQLVEVNAFRAGFRSSAN